jgi:hypothetical protein
MFGLLKSLTDLAGDVATIALKPVEIAVDLTGAVVKPIAEVAKEVADEVKSLKD